MKRVKYAVLAAALVAASVAAPALDSEAAAKKGTWKKDSKGWWVSYGKGWAQSEWYQGYWLKKDGYWDGVSKKAKWSKDSKGWWYGYKGWYAKKQWQKIDGKWYYFDKEGYMAADEYIGGWYLTKSGAWSGPKYQWRKGKGANAGKQWFGASGNKYVKDGWYKINGNMYYFDKDGWLVTWDVQEINGKAYGFDSQGHEKTITQVALGKEVKKASVEFNVADADKKQAAADMDAFLVMTTTPGTKKAVLVDGVKKTIEHKTGSADYIAIDGEKLTDYVAKTKTNKVVVESSGKIDTLLSKIKYAEGAKYTLTVKVGNVTFTNFSMKDGKVFFAVNGKFSRCMIDLKTKTGYFLEDVTKKDFYTTLVSVGALDSAATKVLNPKFPTK